MENINQIERKQKDDGLAETDSTFYGTENIFILFEAKMILQ